MIARLVLGLTLLTATAAHAGTDLDYCRAMAIVERERCHAEHALEILDCKETAALERYLGEDSARANLRECRDDAAETCNACRAGLVPCGDGTP